MTLPLVGAITTTTSTTTSAMMKQILGVMKIIDFKDEWENGVLLCELCARLNPLEKEENKKVCTYDRRGHLMKSRLVIAGSEVNVRSRAQVLYILYFILYSLQQYSYFFFNYCFLFHFILLHFFHYLFLFSALDSLICNFFDVRYHTGCT